MERIAEEFKRVGKKYPLLLTKMFEVSDLTDLELIILKCRYVDGLLFKQIEYKTGKSERHVFRCHNSGIKKTVAKFNMLALLDLICQ